uniref:C2H2-type domain-containing protein n=1 Tax=Cacopsylla melanoneura TaxID=428564 RepID=A0A8D8M2I3_9HEMI
MSPYTSVGVTLTVLLMSWSAPQANAGFNVNGYWTYSPSFEAMSGIKGMKKIGSHEDNLFLIPERNSFKIGNVTVYQCKMCDYRGRHPNEYLEHAKEKHFFPGHEKDHQWIIDLAKRQDHNYTCNVCNETYKSEMALLWHITKYDHVLNDHDHDLCAYLRARIQLNETVGRKVVYHPIARPFYKIKEPSNESDVQHSSELNELFRGYQKATYIPDVDISSGDISNPKAHDDIVKTGISKYQKEGVEKRFKKINGVNVYQRSPEEIEYVMTDETAEQARLDSAAARLADRRARRKAYAEQDTGELIAKEEAESYDSCHSASYYRRQLDEYGPFASHSDKLGDRQERRKTTRVIIRKPDKNKHICRFT